MRVLAAIAWNGHDTWAFQQKDSVLTCLSIIGEEEPKRLFAWSLLDLGNYEQFLLVILQKFHMTAKQNLPDVVGAIIHVQNAFARAVSPPEELVYDTEERS